MDAFDILKEDLCGQLDYAAENPVTVSGITLAGDRRSQTEFTKLGATISAARTLLAGEARDTFDAGEIPVKSSAGEMLSLPRLQVLQLILAYADALYARWAGIEAAKSAINAATDAEEARSAFAAADNS